MDLGLCAQHVGFRGIRVCIGFFDRLCARKCPGTGIFRIDFCDRSDLSGREFIVAFCFCRILAFTFLITGHRIIIFQGVFLSSKTPEGYTGSPGEYFLVCIAALVGPIDSFLLTDL